MRQLLAAEFVSLSFHSKAGFTVRPPRARREKPKVSAFTSAKTDRIMALEPELVIGFSDLQADIADLSSFMRLSRASSVATLRMSDSFALFWAAGFVWNRRQSSLVYAVNHEFKKVQLLRLPEPYFSAAYI